MISTQSISGVNAIAAMPFNNEGEIDYISFSKMVSHLAKSGIHGLTLFGIASEFYKLTDYERDHLAHRFLGGLSGSKVYSTFSITDHSTHHAVNRARYYEKIGADVLMLLPPFFLQPTIEQIKHHIFSILDAVNIPVLIQYAPSETRLEITPQTMADIAKCYPHAVFKIECNPPKEYTHQFLQFAPDAVVMNGYAGLYMLDMLSVGGKGVMPGCSFAEIYVAIYQMWQQGNKEGAKELHSQLLPYIQRWMSHCEYIIQVEKTLLKIRGLITDDYCRLPAYPLPVEEEALLNQFLQQFSCYLLKR